MAFSVDWRIDAPRYIWTSILSAFRDHATDAAGAPMPFPLELACMSYRLDLDAGTVKSVREYARIWRWTKKQVELRLPLIRTEVDSWQKKPVATGRHLGDSKGDSQGDNNGGNRSGNDEKGDTQGDKNEGPGRHLGDTYYTPPVEEGRESGAREEIPDGWDETTMPVYLAFLRWQGHPPDTSMTQVIRLLLQDEGSPSGARIFEDGYAGKLFNGYTPQNLVDAVEAFSMSKHHSPAVFVKHVAGLIVTRNPKPANGNGAYQRTSEQPPGQPAGYDELESRVRREMQRRPGTSGPGAS